MFFIQNLLRRTSVRWLLGYLCSTVLFLETFLRECYCCFVLLFVLFYFVVILFCLFLPSFPLLKDFFLLRYYSVSHADAWVTVSCYTDVKYVSTGLVAGFLFVCVVLFWFLPLKPSASFSTMSSLSLSCSSKAIISISEKYFSICYLLDWVSSP